MGMESNEVKTHSAIIGELLNPKGSHGLEDKPLRLFIKLIIEPLYKNNDDEFTNKFSFNFENTQSYVEDFAGKINEEATEGGRIDIVIKDNKNKVFLIENKIYAGEQKNQLIRYKNFYPNAPILFLTLYGKDAESAQDLEKNKDYFTISYELDIIFWLEECLKEAVKYPMLREVICQYINLIKKLTHQTINHELKKEIMDLIKNNFSEAMEIAKNYNTAKNDVIKIFWDKLEHTAREKLAKENWIVKQDSKLISKYSHLLFSNKENDKAYLYYRFNINDGTIEYGIILKEGKGSDVFNTIKESNPKLIPENFKTSDFQSVIWKKDDDYNFSDPELLTKIFKEYTGNTKETEDDFSKKIVEFIKNNKDFYNKILENLPLKKN